MQVNINNNNGPDPREIPGDDMMLHWYIPQPQVATRRKENPPLGAWLTTAAVTLGARIGHRSLNKLLLDLCRHSGVRGYLKETSRGILHAATGYSQTEEFTIAQTLGLLFGSKKVIAGTGFMYMYNKIYEATKPNSWVRFLFTWRKHAAFTSAVCATGFCIAVAGVIYCIVRQIQVNREPYEPEGISHSGLMCEVTQQEALATPTHFACPVGLRDHILEKIFLQDRNPVLIQRVRSMAGKWCDDRGVNPHIRPAYIAGAVACAMSVSRMEQDLLQFERQWEVRQARGLLARHHAMGDGPPRQRPGFWEWLMRPGRR